MQAHDPVTIGRDAATHDEVRILDTDRQRGTYILGIGGAGKTSMLLNMIDYDIRCGHGLFFLDPHGDALARIRTNPAYAERLERDEILLDPTIETGSFGINLLACRNPADMNARNTAYNRTYRVFERLFSNEAGMGTWGVWLQEMLQYTLHAFIENQDYTLADVPEFLTDPAFRNHIVSNIRHNQRVAHYWQHDFGALPFQQQMEHAQALKTRVNILLNDYVHHIVGQKQTTIDFSESIARKAIILVSLPLSLSPDVKRTIGLILLSELLNAVEARRYLSASQRKHFGIYVDEVQHFAQSEDFSFLFTQARKFGIATTIAHQERFGQFADNKKMAGATAAAANIICFQLSPLDVPDLGRLFADAPPTKIQQEQVLVISQNPVADLLRGHPNPEINAFAQKQLRQLHEGRADAREDMEGERLIRMDLMDEAMFYRLEDQIAGLEQTRAGLAGRRHALSGAEAALQAARGQTDKMLSLYDRARRYREALRYLDRFFVAVMEGRVTPGTEEFSELIISIVTASHIPPSYTALLSMYLSLLYGDAHKRVAIPIAFAHDVVPEEYALLNQEATIAFRQRNEAFLEERRARYRRRAQEADEERERFKQHLREGMLSQIRGWKVKQQPQTTSDADANALIATYIPLLAHPALRDELKPFTTARFASPWREAFPPSEHSIPLILKETERILADNRAMDRWYSFTEAALRRGETRFNTSVVESFRDFVRTHGEGALVVLRLLQTVLSPRGWLDAFTGSFGWVEAFYKGDYERIKTRDTVHYPRSFTMLHMPALIGHHSFDVLLALDRCNWILIRSHKTTNYGIYYWRWDKQTPYRLARPSAVPLVRITFRQILPIKQDVDDMQGLWSAITDVSPGERDHRRRPLFPKEKALMDEVVNFFWQHTPYRFSKSEGEALYAPIANLASKEDKLLALAYLMCRACDIALFGEPVANLTFPHPSIQSVPHEHVTRSIDMMVATRRDIIRANDEKDVPGREERIAQYAEDELEQHLEDEYARINRLPARFDRGGSEARRKLPRPLRLHMHPGMPSHLPERVLTQEQREALRNGCLKMLLHGHEEGWNATATLNGIDELVHFCGLLSQPNNHVKVGSGKWVETTVNTRSERDMADEMVRKLQDLETQTAYARVHAESDGRTRVIKRLIKPPALLPVPEGAPAPLRLPPGVYKDRTLIEEEIRQRQATWRGEKHVGGHSKKPPPTAH